MADENWTLSTAQALADVATNEDKLFHSGYVKGVSRFIKECATPMTIAIQGEWGTGKTSLINLIDAEFRAEEKPQAEAEFQTEAEPQAEAQTQAELEPQAEAVSQAVSEPQAEEELQSEEESAEDDDPSAGEYCKDIIGVATVDVWQHSVANSKVNLLEVLMREIMVKLSGADLEATEKFSEFISAASTIVGEVFDIGGDSGGDSEDDSSFCSILGSLFTPEDESKSESEYGSVSVKDIESFKSSFVELLQQSAEENGKSKDSRFVVFVDGLDQIDPQVAIDFMEQLKSYLDCARCVFVLAVDEQTVFDGVRKKFGDKVDEKRKKVFFNKLVQVPLRIPISAYNLEKYLKDLLKDEKEPSGDFVEVIKTLLKEPTPLGIKRYINTMYLYQSIFGGADDMKESSLAMLLAAVILELEGAKGFDAVANCARDDEAQFAENLMIALEGLGLDDGVNRSMLPSLWNGGEGDDVDVAKRSDFLSWIRKLK